MTVTVTIEATKPSNVEWFPQSSEANYALVQSLNEWTASQPGFINQTGSNPTSDSRIVTINWDTVENYIAWDAGRANRPEYIARMEYNNANGIVANLTETFN